MRSIPNLPPGPDGRIKVAAPILLIDMEKHTNMKTIATVVGARPQFIKVAPVSKALAATGPVREALIHTGQYHDARHVGPLP